MKCKDLMTRDVVCCTAEDDCAVAAKLMREHDCGLVPVVDSHDNKRPVGVVTDRDICTRVAAENKQAAETQVKDVMCVDIAACNENDEIDQALQIMETSKIRRILVTDDNGACVGIIAQADIALSEELSDKTREFLASVSEPTRPRPHAVAA